MNSTEDVQRCSHNRGCAEKPYMMPSYKEHFTCMCVMTCTIMQGCLLANHSTDSATAKMRLSGLQAACKYPHQTFQVQVYVLDADSQATYKSSTGHNNTSCMPSLDMHCFFAATQSRHAAALPSTCSHTTSPSQQQAERQKSRKAVCLPGSRLCIGKESHSSLSASGVTAAAQRHLNALILKAPASWRICM